LAKQIAKRGIRIRVCRHANHTRPPPRTDAVRPTPKTVRRRNRTGHTPGHTPGSICLYSDVWSLLISGDTLFAGSYGRYDLSGGDLDALRGSLTRLAELPAATQVYPGHGGTTTIGAEGWLPLPTR